MNAYSYLWMIKSAYSYFMNDQNQYCRPWDKINIGFWFWLWRLRDPYLRDFFKECFGPAFPVYADVMMDVAVTEMLDKAARLFRSADPTWLSRRVMRCHAHSRHHLPYQAHWYLFINLFLKGYIYPVAGTSHFLRILNINVNSKFNLCFL